MGVFEDLQNIATKEVKYKQGALFNNDLGFKLHHLNQGDLKKVGRGICAALSMAYLHDFLSGASENTMPNKLRFQRGKGLFDQLSNSKMDEHTLKLGVESAAGQLLFEVTSDNNYIYNHMSDNEATISAFKSLAEKYSLSVETAGEWLPKQIYKSDSKTFQTSGGYYIVEHIKDTMACHACALIVYGGSVRFFDPNIGGYKINKDKCQPFFSKYAEVYGEQGVPETQLKWKLRGATSYPVKAKGV